ncbi:PHD finger protein 13, partial [Dimargaris xerosporica]
MSAGAGITVGLMNSTLPDKSCISMSQLTARKPMHGHGTNRRRKIEFPTPRQPIKPLNFRAHLAKTRSPPTPSNQASQLQLVSSHPSSRLRSNSTSTPTLAALGLKPTQHNFTFVLEANWTGHKWICTDCDKTYKLKARLLSHFKRCAKRSLNISLGVYTVPPFQVDSDAGITFCLCMVHGQTHRSSPTQLVGRASDRLHTPSALEQDGDSDGRPMIQCDSCFLWLHMSCVHVSEDHVPQVYICPRCRPIHQSHGQGGLKNPRAKYIQDALAVVHSSPAKPTRYRTLDSMNLARSSSGSAEESSDGPQGSPSMLFRPASGKGKITGTTQCDVQSSTRFPLPKRAGSLQAGPHGGRKRIRRLPDSARLARMLAEVPSPPLLPQQTGIRTSGAFSSHSLTPLHAQKPPRGPMSRKRPTKATGVTARSANLHRVRTSASAAEQLHSEPGWSQVVIPPANMFAASRSPTPPTASNALPPGPLGTVMGPGISMGHRPPALNSDPLVPALDSDAHLASIALDSTTGGDLGAIHPDLLYSEDPHIMDSLYGHTSQSIGCPTLGLSSDGLMPPLTDFQPPTELDMTTYSLPLGPNPWDPVTTTAFDPSFPVPTMPLNVPPSTMAPIDMSEADAFLEQLLSESDIDFHSHSQALMGTSSALMHPPVTFSGNSNQATGPMVALQPMYSEARSRPSVSNQLMPMISSQAVPVLSRLEPTASPLPLAADGPTQPLSSQHIAIAPRPTTVSAAGVVCPPGASLTTQPISSVAVNTMGSTLSTFSAKPAAGTAGPPLQTDQSIMATSANLNANFPPNLGFDQAALMSMLANTNSFVAS